MGNADVELYGVYHGEAVLPDALERIGYEVFDGCPKINVIRIENNFAADCLKRKYGSMTILPAKLTMVGDKPLWELRRQKDVVILEGVQEIGAQWFKNTGVERVTIPKSVRAF